MKTKLTFILTIAFLAINSYSFAQALVANITSSTNVSCNGLCDGSATVTPSGGTTPYTYLWDDWFTQIDSTANGLCAGVYCVTITDAISDTATSCVTITEPAVLTVIILSPTVVTCYGACDGSATIIAEGGTPAFCYLWSDGQTTATATNLCAGTFNFIITDDNGCTATTSVTITEPPLLTASISAQYDASNVCNGSATVTASGGIPPYSYQWDDILNQTTDTITGLCGGNYNVTVTDFNGCSATTGVSITNSVDSILILDTSIVIVDTISVTSDTCILDNLIPVDSAYINNMIIVNDSIILVDWIFWQNGSPVTLNNIEYYYDTTGFNVIYLTLICNTGSKEIYTNSFIDIYDISIISNRFENISYKYNYSIYPNPFNSTTTFEIKGMNQPLTFELYNIIGKQVRTISDITGKKFIISRENLPNGIYIYKISSKDKLICAGKLVVN